MSLNRDTLVSWREESKFSGDQKTVMLIDQLLETYNQLDAETAQKRAVIKASAGIQATNKQFLANIQSLTECNNNLIAAATLQDNAMSSAVQAFRKIYDIAIYGNEIFKAELLLRLWIITGKFVSSRTPEEMNNNTISIMSLLNELSENKYLVDMRDNLISFSDFITINSVDSTEDDVNTNDNIGDDFDGEEIRSTEGQGAGVNRTGIDNSTEHNAEGVEKSV